MQAQGSLSSIGVNDVVCSCVLAEYLRGLPVDGGLAQLEDARGAATSAVNGLGDAVGLGGSREDSAQNEDEPGAEASADADGRCSHILQPACYLRPCFFSDSARTHATGSFTSYVVPLVSTINCTSTLLSCSHPTSFAGRSSSTVPEAEDGASAAAGDAPATDKAVAKGGKAGEPRPQHHHTPFLWYWLLFRPFGFHYPMGSAASRCVPTPLCGGAGLHEASAL